jgi:alcohol dehydrogenase (cytochrome c)
MRFLAALLTVAAIVVLVGCGGDGPPKTPPDVGWTSFGGDPSGRRFSPLDQIDTTTVKRLGVAWTFDPGRATDQWESFPIVTGHTMYVTTNSGDVIALDAVTGRERWSYSPDVDLLAGGGVGEVQPVSRGVAVGGNRIYVLTYDDQLIALRPGDGKELWKTRVADPVDGMVQTSPPTYADGKLIVGGSGSDTLGVAGSVAAFDATDGHRLWRFQTAPHGGRVWMPPTVDTHTNTVYAGTGNPSPAIDPDRQDCEGWTSGMVALNLETGALRWGAREVCPDTWDYDGGQPPLLNGDTVAHANKSGTYWLRDAKTGKQLAPPQTLTAQTTPRPKPTKQGKTICPGALGGIAYSPAAVQPDTDTIFQPVVRLCMTYRAGHPRPKLGAIVVGGGLAQPPTGVKASGAVVALSSTDGKIRWRKQLPAPVVGGALATQGGLVFTGCDDGFLYALDAHTGQTRWRGRVGLPFGTAPISYRVDGTQYVAIVAGGSATAGVTGITPGARLIVLKLDGRSLPSAT